MARWGNPGGVEERGMSTLGFPRNLGETDVSTEQRQRGSRKRNLQVPSWTSVTAKRTTDVNGGTDGRGKTEVRKDGRQLSELLIVPQKRVNASLAEPVEGSGSRYRTTVGVKHDEYSGTRDGAETLPLLTDPEQAVYQSIKRNALGQNVRLEQERIAWDVAWKTLQQVI
jgi:hypothetical protein